MRIAFIGATTMGLQLFEPWTINGFGDRAPPSPEGQKAATNLIYPTIVAIH